MYEKTILVVDDEPRTREGLKRMLEKWADGRYLILTASNGIDALERMKNDKIHILLTDIRMPELTGLQFLKKAKMLNSSVVSIIFSECAGAGCYYSGTLVDSSRLGDAFGKANDWKPDR